MTTETASWVGLVLSGGRYEVIEKLGGGGMGFVYRARDRNLDSDVVIKVPRPAMLQDAQFAGRFMRELRSLVKLVHPHIVRMTDADEYEDVPFAVLQYLPGGSLRDRQRHNDRGEPLSLGLEALDDWLEDIADALDFIHKQRYIHRDVKPDNVLFDAHGNAFLSDFGVAKALTTEDPNAPPASVYTGVGIVLGTPQYMAPEILMGQGYDGRADQYALGVALYEMLSGRFPFDGATPAAIFMKHMTQTPTPLAEVIPSIPAGVSAAVQRALTRLPRQRFPDCRSLARAVLEGTRQHGPAPAVRDTGWSKVACPGCQRVFKVPVEIAQAKRLRCSGCGRSFYLKDFPQALLPPRAEPPPETGPIDQARLDTGVTPAPGVPGFSAWRERLGGFQRRLSLRGRRRWLLIGLLAALGLAAGGLAAFLIRGLGP
jgi:serine/threonine-protein kinase